MLALSTAILADLFHQVLVPDQVRIPLSVDFDVVTIAYMHIHIVPTVHVSCLYF